MSPVRNFAPKMEFYGALKTMKNLSKISNGVSYTLILPRPISIRYHLTFLNLKLFWILSLISMVALLVFYIFQVNFLTHQIYSIQSQEEKLNQLSHENENLEINFSKSNSLANLENYLSNRNFEKANPGQIKYIKIPEGTVVSK